MNQNKLLSELNATLPELESEISEITNNKTPISLMRSFNRYTQKMVEQHNDLMIEKCVKLIGEIYSKGDIILKNAVADVFIFSLDRILNSCNFYERKNFLNTLPKSLHALYLKQVYSSAI